MKAFKSGKQRRRELKAARRARQMRRDATCVPAAAEPLRAAGRAPVCPARLRPTNSYDAPEFVHRGYYEDVVFTCVDCGARGVWTAERQRWWYEVAKGDVFTTARRCAPCRARERERRAAARHEHLAGLLRKNALRAP